MSVSTEEKRKEGGLAEGGRVVLHALLIALVIQTLLFRLFNIPSGSMKATLLIDDETGGADRVRRWRETLPNGVTYESLDLEDNGSLDNTEEYLVPPGHYFMMGDNRDNSIDSRVLSAVGYVPFENLVGKAQMIFFSIGDGEPAWHIWRWPRSVRWSRLFTIVR
jgi:signal peptidase I